MVFNAAVTNNDDHPRNHALLRRQKGWRLSPGYDLVPAPMISLERRDLALTVGNFGRTASIYNLLSQVGRFGLSAEEARTEIDRIVEVVRHWRDSFFACGVYALHKRYDVVRNRPTHELTGFIRLLTPGDPVRLFVLGELDVLLDAVEDTRAHVQLLALKGRVPYRKGRIWQRRCRDQGVGASEVEFAGEARGPARADGP